MSKRKGTYSLFLLLIVAGGLLVRAAFSWKAAEPSYPGLLVEADSAIAKGRYTEADSLLARYDAAHADVGEAIRLYCRLLRLTRSYNEDALTDADIPAIDSLCSYYADFGSRDKYARALLFQARLCHLHKDYPVAMALYMQAQDELEEGGSSVIRGWIAQAMGDVSFDQRMFDECKPCYLRFYAISKANNDKLRMAHAAIRMGRLYTIESEVDSIVFYYQQAIDLGRGLPEEANIVPYAQTALCDIYIQTEQYDRARDIMPRNSLNTDNWAYWHLAQGQLDSAMHYFGQMVGQYDWYVETRTLRMLADLSLQAGNERQALAYYGQLASAEDSLKEVSQVEETQDAIARHHYGNVARERDRIKHLKQQEDTLVVFLLIFFTLLGFIVLLLWKYSRRRSEMELVHEQLLRKEKEEEYQQSLGLLEANKERLAELEGLLAEARSQHNAAGARKLEQETLLLQAQNAGIEAGRQHKELLKEELRMSDLYRRLKSGDSTTKHTLTEEEWNELAESYLNPIYDRFTNRLLALANLSPTELRICYMIKLDVDPVNMAAILCKSKSAISQARKRMYQKLTGQTGSGTQLDELIRSF